jgi:Pre-mRNA splicing factor/N-terminal domain of CBF1 interacting co-repressor CIR
VQPAACSDVVAWRVTTAWRSQHAATCTVAAALSGRVQNLEEVWKREQQAAAEQRKLDELRKQYDEERKDAEFKVIAEEAGYRREERVDWMYGGSMASKKAADAAASGVASAAAGAPTAAATAAAAAAPHEAPLMGRPPAADEHLSRAERAALLPTFLATATPAGQNEAWARLNNDPLLAIKKQEQDALKRVRENPVKMQAILKEVRENMPASMCLHVSVWM